MPPADNQDSQSLADGKGPPHDQEDAMLVFSRTKGESLMLGDEIVVQVVEVRGDKVRLGILCPKDTTVHRKEVFDLIQREQQSGEGAGATPPRDEQ
jgi:carbon storage regulator